MELLGAGIWIPATPLLKCGGVKEAEIDVHA